MLSRLLGSVRLAVALAGASIVGLLFWLGSRRSVRGLVARWPYWSGVVIGLLWWLMLTPSLVGWAIVAACLIGSSGQVSERTGNRSEAARQGVTPPWSPLVWAEQNPDFG